MSKYESYFAKGGSCPKPSFPCTPADAIRRHQLQDLLLR